MNLEQRLHETALDNLSERSKRKMTKRSGSGFYDMGIAPKLVKEIDRLNFTAPTPIQKDAIPLGIEGKDIIAIAKTGSGKTLAFGIPMLQRLSKMKKSTGLVLVPTRELAIQVEESIRSINRSADLRSVVLIGGAAMSLQRKALSRHPRIIIATPGRLMDHLERRTVNLSKVEVFVLDEADRMLDMGFIPDIKKIMKTIPEKRQTMLFSATMPKEIEAIADALMNDPTRIEVDQSGVTPVEVSHEMFFIKNQDKKRLLAVQLKQYTGPVLVFTRTKRMASKLTTKVNEMGFNVAEIHSNRSLGQRRNALDGFKQGRYRVLIATDIAARGIDVSGIELVVNYDMPATTEDYVHRIGRTGRAGKTGHAISYATNEQKGYVRSLERFMKTKLAVSAVPTLPTESTLLREGGRVKPVTKDSIGDKPSRRQSAKKQTTRERFTKERSTRRSGFGKPRPQQVDPLTYAPRKVASGQTETKRKYAKRSDSDRPVAKRKYVKRSDSDRPASKRKFAKRSDSDRTEYKRKDFKETGSRKNGPKQTGSEYRDFLGGTSKKYPPRKYESELSEGKRRYTKKNDTDRPESKRKYPKPRGSRATESDKSNGHPASRWSKFKNSRPTKKKKSVGQGSGRKKKAKRK